MPADDAHTRASGPAAAADAGAPARRPRDGDAVLVLHVVLAALASFLCTLIWGLSGGGDFWPGWVYHGLVISLAIHYGLRRALDCDDPARRRVRVHVALAVTAGAAVTLVWAFDGPRTTWIAWPLLGLGTSVFLHALWQQLGPGLRREQELTERVDVLTRTRRGALDVQAAELRRIERDLHDGAQARLVALSMQLGRAEAQLEDRPETAELVRRARTEAAAAIAELRDLARGIAPPVLADRGLGAAVQALADRSPVEVETEVAVDRRAPPVLEAAAYFVVAEGLTNVAKHAPASQARVRVRLEDDVLVVEVSDDGAGGADATGGGLSGLRRRVEALDGALEVVSPAGAGTWVRAELPCGS